MGGHLSGYETRDPVQSWTMANNPEPQLNFDLRGTPRRAGDVNGDGIDDYVYAATPRDERTPSNLEDRTGKTALYFGGGTPENPDQLLYDELPPVGDLNGDGFADALKIDGSTARIFTGSSSGYTDSGETVSLSSDAYGSVVGFTDVDADGVTDALLYTVYFPGFDVISGAADLSNVEVNTFSPSGEAGFDYKYRAADLDSDGDSEVVRLEGGDNTKRLRIYQVSGGALEEEQSFVAEELSDTFFRSLDLWPIRIDDDEQQEIAVRYRVETLVFDADASGTYDSTPVSFGEGAPVPVGDLDGDGRHDFYTGGAIAFGPANLADGPVDAYSLPDDVGGATASSDSRLGDLDGDGLDDAVLGYGGGSQSNPTTGRTFVYGNPDRSALTTEAVTYPYGQFVQRTYYTSNVGDLNGDGVPDLAIPRRFAGRTEIFFGGEPISQEPDLTLPTPYTSYLGPTLGGDFNGDGFSDVAAVYGSQVDFFFGGPSMDATPDHTIDGADFLPNPDETSFEFADNIGDVNNDGVDDLLATEGYDASNENGELEAFLFFGGSELPSTPDQTITYGSVDFVSDDYAEGLGDVNDDGIGDFALTDPDRENDNGTAGAMYVYFGTDGSPDFSSPDLTITPEPPEDEGYGYFPVGVTSGDFNDDGHPDIAAKPQSVDAEVNDVSIHVYHGGPDLDEQADRRLNVPADPIAGFDFDENGLVDLNYGQLVSVPSSDQPDGLLLTTAWSFTTNALLYRGSGTEPTTVLRAPNQDAGLGGISFANSSNAAIGDFDDDGSTDLVLTQDYDDNDAAFSSRVYGYTLGEGSSTTSGSAEVAAGETGTVPLGATGAEVMITENNDSDGGQIQFTRTNARPPNESFDGSATAPDGSTVAPNTISPRHWEISGAGLSGLTFKVRLGIAGAEGISAPDKLLVVTREDDAEAWTPVNTTRSGEMLVSSELSSFSSFTVAGDSTDNALPVELAGFDATVDGDAVTLSWQTASETNNAEFHVQRRRGERKNGREGAWTTVGSVEGSGTTSRAQSYRFTDEDLPYEADKLTYRLKQVDTDGTEHFSGEVTVERGVEELKLLGTYPNPAQQQATVRYALPDKQEATIRLYDVLGRQVRTVVSGKQEGRHQRTLDVGALSSGVYFLRLRAGGETETQRLTVVQ